MNSNSSGAFSRPTKPWPSLGLASAGTGRPDVDLSQHPAVHGKQHEMDKCLQELLPTTSKTVASTGKGIFSI